MAVMKKTNSDYYIVNLGKPILITWGDERRHFREDEIEAQA